MSYFVSEDKKMSGKCTQLISRSMDKEDQPASNSISQSVIHSVLDRQTDFSQPVSLSVLDRETDFYKCLISFQMIQEYYENEFNLYHEVWI